MAWMMMTVFPVVSAVGVCTLLHWQPGPVPALDPLVPEDLEWVWVERGLTQPRTTPALSVKPVPRSGQPERMRMVVLHSVLERSDWLARASLEHCCFGFLWLQPHR